MEILSTRTGGYTNARPYLNYPTSGWQWPKAPPGVFYNPFSAFGFSFLYNMGSSFGFPG